MYSMHIYIYMHRSIISSISIKLNYTSFSAVLPVIPSPQTFAGRFRGAKASKSEALEIRAEGAVQKTNGWRATQNDGFLGS